MRPTEPSRLAQYGAVADIIGTERSPSCAAAFRVSGRVVAALESAGRGPNIAAVPGDVGAVTTSMQVALSGHPAPDGTVVAPFRSVRSRAAHHTGDRCDDRRFDR